MKSRPALSSNFAHLQSHDEQLLRLGMLAERYFSDDPNTCLLKLRQLSEVLAQLVASNVGILDRPEDGQYELLSRLRDHGILPSEIHQLLGEVRRTGNSANHALAGDHRTALAMLKIVWQIAERDDSLDISWLNDDNAESSADLPEPAVLAASAMEEMAAIVEDLRGILAELGEDVEEVVG